MPQPPINNDNWEKRARENRKRYRQFLEKADRREVLKKLPALHEEAFGRIDCLRCANCCKNYSPRFKPPDIRRIAAVLGLTETELISTYLMRDEEGDYVVRTLPCPFLEPDNKCRIYEDRPSDCRRFPYTDEDVLLKRPRITLKNAEFCPIVVSVLEGLI